MTVVPLCHSCKHAHPIQYGPAQRWTCDAFPEQPGIPDAILRNQPRHTRPYPGDHGILYEPRLSGSPKSATS